MLGAKTIGIESRGEVLTVKMRSKRQALSKKTQSKRDMLKNGGRRKMIG